MNQWWEERFMVLILSLTKSPISIVLEQSNEDHMPVLKVRQTETDNKKMRSIFATLPSNKVAS